MLKALCSYLRHLHRFWRYASRTEHDSIAFIKSLDLHGTTVLDIGANYGIYTYWLSNCIGPNGTVVAFEAQPELKHEIQNVVRMFKLKNIDLRMIALSDKCGQTVLHRAKVGDGGGSIENESSEHIESQSINVTTVTLDSIKDTFQRPVRFVKCDVEGHESAVIDGSKQFLLEDKPTILIEIHQQHVPSITAQLSELGFEGSFFSGSKRYPIIEFNEQPYRKDGEVHRNYIFEFTA